MTRTTQPMTPRKTGGGEDDNSSVPPLGSKGDSLDDNDDDDDERAEPPPCRKKQVWESGPKACDLTICPVAQDKCQLENVQKTLYKIIYFTVLTNADTVLAYSNHISIRTFGSHHPLVVA